MSTSTASPTAVEWPRWEDPAFYLQDSEAIQASMGAARRAARIYRYESPKLNTGVWVVSRLQDIRAIGSNPEVFGNRYGFLIGDAMKPELVMDQLPPWAQEQLREPGLSPAQIRRVIVRAKLSLGDPELENVAYVDPPRHNQLRAVLSGALKPSLVRSLKPRVAELADEVLDAIEPGEELDFVKTFGRIPTTLMTELVGVPRETREEFIAMASEHLNAVAVRPDRTPEEIEQAEQATKRFRDYIEALLAERKAAGSGDDLVSVVARSEIDGEPVPQSTALAFISFFINSGETTRALLSHLALCLAHHPEQRQRLVEQPELLPNALEETMRWYPVNWTHSRTALEPTEVAGQAIEKEDYLIVAYASANRDEEVYERPDEYDIAREFPIDHLGFGYGEHGCPGRIQATTIVRTIWERILARYGDWELLGEPQTFSTPFIRGVVSMPMRFSG
jgi:cytochrome P450